MYELFAIASDSYHLLAVYKEPDLDIIHSPGYHSIHLLRK